MISKKFWGQSLHINLQECNRKVLDKTSLKSFCNLLCKEVGMRQYGEPMVERFGKGKLSGNSVLQFIETSSISIHADEYFNRVFIDIFSCKKFDRYRAKSFAKKYFSANVATSTSLMRF